MAVRALSPKQGQMYEVVERTWGFLFTIPPLQGWKLEAGAVESSKECGVSSLSLSPSPLSPPPHSQGVIHDVLGFKA